MDEYVEKMIKDKFLLDIITTAFYEYGKPVEVLHPDLKHQFDLVLSCNGFTQILKMQCKFPVKTSKLKFIGFDKSSKFDDSSEFLMKSLGVKKKEITNIILEVEPNNLNYKIKISHEEKSINELLAKIFGLELLPDLALLYDENYKFEKSTFSEQFGTYSFIRDLRQTAWLTFDETKITILRGEVDAFGYDLVLICKEIVRYVQLKLSKSGMQPVNIALADKKGACVVWQRENKKGKKWKEKLEYGYHFLGEMPNGCLNFLKTCEVYKHKGKPKPSKRKVKFTDFCDTSCDFYLDESNSDYKIYKNQKHRNKKNLSPNPPMVNLINILFGITPQAHLNV